MELRFNGGDIISCAIKHTKGIASHIMLAVSEHHVIHIPGIEAPKPKNETRIEYTGFLDAARDFQLCDRRTTDYDQEFQRTCGLRRIRSADAAITAANNSFNDYQAKGKNLHYDSMKCNCEHWVLAWKYGLAWSIQINNWVLFTKKTQSAECQAPGADKCS